MAVFLVAPAFMPVVMPPAVMPVLPFQIDMPASLHIVRAACIVKDMHPRRSRQETVDTDIHSRRSRKFRQSRRSRQTGRSGKARAGIPYSDGCGNSQQK